MGGRGWGQAAPAWAERSYEAYVGVLFDLLKFSIKGRITGEVDRAAGRYRVVAQGAGIGVTGRTESVGVVRAGRFVPTETTIANTVSGRDNRTHIVYDLDRRRVRFHSIGHTLLLGRRREVDDVVAMPAGTWVDDLFSAELNFAAGTLDRDPDGAHRLTVVRRAKTDDEGADDVSASGYRAELLTVRFRPSAEAETGRLQALVDITGFSSWARASRPAQVTFGRDRQLEMVRSSLILSTTFTLRLFAGS